MGEIESEILQSVSSGRKMLVRLLDPEKFDPSTLCEGFDMYFVGGSTGGDTSAVFEAVHNLTHTPAVLFPGQREQLSAEADAVLFLSLMNSNDPRFLVGIQTSVAEQIARLGIESIPMGYILLDGGVESTTARITGCEVLSQDDLSAIRRLALTSQYLGKRLIYLEAGSGARVPVKPAIISAVKEVVNIPLIVGGGICTPKQMCDAFDAGADIVVIGNHFEQHHEQIGTFIESKPTGHTPVGHDERFMRLALNEARKALLQGEIPVGCVITCKNQIVGRGHNLTQTLKDVTAHAEMQALTAAAESINGKYLSDCELYVTVEPCVMCAGAIGWAQVGRVVYGTADVKKGFTTLAPRALHPKCEVTAGVLADECKALLQEFFQSKRS